MEFSFKSTTVKIIRARTFSVAFGTPQRVIVTGMVIAIAISMSMLGASGNLFQPIPAYSPNANQATYHVIVTPDAVPVGEITNITAFVTSYIHYSSINVDITVMGPAGSGISASVYATIATNSHGDGSVTFRFPGLFSGLASTYAIGTYSVVAGFGQIYSSVFAYAHFIVFENSVAETPEIFMNPGFGPVGTSVSIQGYHFAPDSAIALYYDGVQVQTTPSYVASTPSGSFSTNFTIPSSSGFNTIEVQDQYGNHTVSLFGVGSASQPGPKLISSTSSVIVNETAIADFMPTIGVQVVLTGTNLSNGARSDITAELYTMIPPNITGPSLENTQFYDVKVLNVTEGNATISIASTLVKNDSLNAMQYWNGDSWVGASSVYVSRNTIVGIIPIRDLGNTTIAIGHLVPRSNPVVYIAAILPFAAAAIIVPITLIRRKRAHGSEPPIRVAVPLNDAPVEEISVPAESGDHIRDAYLNGWSERDVAKIFDTTRTRIRAYTKGLDASQREIHITKNKDWNRRLNTAVRNHRKEKEINLSFYEIKREFHGQSLNEAKGNFGTVLPYVKQGDGFSGHPGEVGK